jgi:hypothetical protein
MNDAFRDIVEAPAGRRRMIGAGRLVRGIYNDHEIAPANDTSDLS